MMSNLISGRNNPLGLLVLSLFLILFSCKKDEKVIDDPDPIISISAPKAEAVIDKDFDVEVEATVANGIKKVELYLNNVKVGSAEVKPFRFTVNILGYSPGNYTIKAIAYSTTDKQSSKEIILTIVKPTLEKPLDFKASRGEFGNRIILKWNNSPGATAYQVYKQDKTTNEFKIVATVSTNTYEDLTIAAPLTQYFYKVRAYNSQVLYGAFSEVDYGYTSGQNFSKALSFGSEGNGNGQFKFAMHVEVDNAGNIYVSDEGNDRVQKFDKNGAFIEVFYSGNGARAIAFLANGNIVATRVQSSSYVQIIDSQKKLIKEWGTYGTGDSQFGNIEEITIDDEQNIYIVDGINNSVKKFDSQGNFLLKFEGATQVSGQNDPPLPFGICFFKNNIYVGSPRNSMIRVYDKTGKFLKTWDAGSPTYAIKARNANLYLACSGYIVKTDEDGIVKEQIGKGQLGNTIPGLAVTKEEEIIVSDTYIRKIISFKRL
jgi:hypothetical protein